MIIIDTDSRDGLYFYLYENEQRFREIFKESSDVLFKKIKADENELLLISADGMCNSLLISQEIINPILAIDLSKKIGENLLDYICLKANSDMEQKRIYTFGEAVRSVLSGSLIILTDEADFCLCFGVQGFPKRGIASANTEVDELCEHEAFTESFKDNLALIRKRLHTSDFKIKNINLGSLTNTNISVCYLESCAKPEMVEKIINTLENADTRAVFGTGNIKELLETGFHIFSAVGTTERPDKACAEMAEGRAVIIVDGSALAVIVPYLFSENFQTADDYNLRPVYALAARIIKYLAFFSAVLLPGIYVSLCTFHQQALPENMLFDIAVQESITPFPVMLETLFIHFVYETVREAGIRLPRAVGSAVSIVGALVIGEAAVSAGLISAPMLIVVALSAVSSFVIPKLYHSVALLRFLFIIIAGFSGFYGITLGLACAVCDICRTEYYGIPVSAPFSPFSLSAMRDTLIRADWKKLGKIGFKIQKMKR